MNVWLNLLFSCCNIFVESQLSSLSSFLSKHCIEILLLKQYMAGTRVVSRQIIF